MKTEVVHIVKNGKYMFGIELTVPIRYYGFFCVIKYIYPIEIKEKNDSSK